MIPKAKTTKQSKLDTLDIKIKNFCVSKDTTKKVKRQHRMGENFLLIIYLVLVSGIYKERLKLKK